MEVVMKEHEFRLYDADSLEYRGSIFATQDSWRYSGITDAHLIATTSQMPLKGVLATLISFNLVYDIVEEEASVRS